MSTAPVIAGWHACNNNAPTGRDRDTIRITGAGAITFLTGMGQNFSVDDVKWVLSINPKCHFFLREYLDPNRIGNRNDRSTWNYNALYQYFDECKRTIDKYRFVIPLGQMHFQIFNEQNMPTWAQWEGFGDTPDDMKRFNEWFVKGVEILRRHCVWIKFGLTPLTPGNRDVWFAGDAPYADYYLHGQQVATASTITPRDVELAKKSCLCKEAIDIADEYYFHVYVHQDEYDVSNPALGLRYIKYLWFLPQKPYWLLECGYPNATLWKGDARLLDWFKLLDLQGNEYRPNGVTFWILGEKKDWGNMFAPGGNIRPFVYDLKKYLDERVVETSPPTPSPEPKPPASSITIHEQDHGYTAEEFKKYLAVTQAFTEITEVFIHHTVNPTPEIWRGRESMLAMKRVYEGKGWTAGPHVFVAPDGIWAFTPVNKQGIGVSGHNAHAIHVEIVGNYEEYILAGRMLRNAIDTFVAICDWLQYDPMALLFHRQYNDTACPGKNITSAFRIEVITSLLRHEAAKRIGTESIRINEGAALYKHAHSGEFGAPLTNEFSCCGYTVQGFTGCILRAQEGIWETIYRSAW